MVSFRAFAVKIHTPGAQQLNFYYHPSWNFGATRVSGFCIWIYHVSKLCNVAVCHLPL